MILIVLGVAFPRNIATSTSHSVLSLINIFILGEATNPSRVYVLLPSW